MDFLDTLYKITSNLLYGITQNIMLMPFVWLIPIPIVIFSAIPRMSLWYKSGRIVLLWVLILISIFFTYGIFPDYDPDWHGESYSYYFLKYNFINAALFATLNVYMGWWEFLWRCIYRQWAWPPLKNLQYGLVSNLCILGSIALMLFVFIMLILIFMRVF
jgi:hypothetical protein